MGISTILETILARLIKKKDLDDLSKSLIYLVSRVGVEPTTT